MSYESTRRCEFAIEPRCRCRCAGRLHGRKLGVLDPGVPAGDLHWAGYQMPLFSEMIAPTEPVECFDAGSTSIYRGPQVAVDLAQVGALARVEVCLVGVGPVQVVAQEVPEGAGWVLLKWSGAGEAPPAQVDLALSSPP